MMKFPRIACFAIAIFAAAVGFNANANATAQVNAPVPAQVTTVTKDICVTDPNARLTPSVKRKKFAQVRRTGPVAARASKLAHARRKPVETAEKAAVICPIGQKPMRVSYFTPLPPAAAPQASSLCQTALGSSASVTTSQASAMMVSAGLAEGFTEITPDDLAAIVSRAIAANPNAAPAIYAYVIKNIDPNNKPLLEAVSRAAYNAAPGQSAGLAYAGISTNPDATMAITQSLLANASDADGSVIRQCAIDANPNLASQIATAAFVPELAGPSAVGENDIRNNINNASGTTTLVPGLPAREPDGSPT